MSRASEIRARIQTAELVLPDGSRFLSRRPSFGEVAETGLVLLPDEEIAPPDPAAEPAVEDNAPDGVKLARARKGYLLMDKVRQFMIRTCLDPIIVPPSTPIPDPDKYVHEGEVAGKEFPYLYASLHKYFGVEVAAKATFPGDSGVAPAPDGESLRVPAQ
jgi:hypothetical protein